MSDWQVGDLAVCVDDAPCRCGLCGGLPVGYVTGRAYAVADVYAKDDGMLCLSLAGVHPKPKPHWRGTNAARFRKVRLDKHEACEEEFRTLLKRKPVHIIGWDGDD